MSEKRSCSNCIGYLVQEGLIEPFECRQCHEVTLSWISSPTGTYGVHCTNCGMKAAADINTACELDRETYSLAINPQDLSNKVLLVLSKLVDKTVLQTKKELSSSPMILEGDLSYIWKMKRLLAQNDISFTINQTDLEKRYFYASKCSYYYARIE